MGSFFATSLVWFSLTSSSKAAKEKKWLWSSRASNIRCTLVTCALQFVMGHKILCTCYMYYFMKENSFKYKKYILHNNHYNFFLISFDNITFDFIKNVTTGLFTFFFIFWMMFSFQAAFLLLFKSNYSQNLVFSSCGSKALWNSKA